jgi:hypothetical protein
MELATKTEIRIAPAIVFRSADANNTDELESIVDGLKTNQYTSSARATVSFAFLVDAPRKNNLIPLKVDVPILATEILVGMQ